MYHVVPPEFQISEDKYELLDLARKVLSEHQPKAEEFLDVDRMRETFFNIGKDLITELIANDLADKYTGLLKAISGYIRFIKDKLTK